jgi:hypothetical protein
VRLDNGFHTTEREKKDFDEHKEENDKRTEEELRKMLKLAGPAMGFGEQDIFEKSKQGKEEKVISCFLGLTTKRRNH